jgi:hypothetical protein
MGELNYNMVEEAMASELKHTPFNAEEVQVVRRKSRWGKFAKELDIDASTHPNIEEKIDDYLAKYPEGGSIEIGTVAGGGTRVLLFLPVSEEYIIVVLKTSRTNEEDKTGAAGINYYYIREMHNRLLDCLSKLSESMSKTEGQVLSIARDMSLVEFRTEMGVHTIQFPTRRLIRAGVDRTGCRVKHMVYEVGTQAVSDLRAAEGQKHQPFSWDDLDPLTPELEERMREAEEQAGDSEE